MTLFSDNNQKVFFSMPNDKIDLISSSLIKVSDIAIRLPSIDKNLNPVNAFGSCTIVCSFFLLFIGAGVISNSSVLLFLGNHMPKTFRFINTPKWARTTNLFFYIDKIVLCIFSQIGFIFHKIFFENSEQFFNTHPI